ncbi:hypothetical protein GCM10010174_83710 [Kutzneria viridogrisea]|uniref:Uncharacterized protein n=2 Tax=Kutzneria TaxID=43356 RepID=W5WGE1_9PSEU|nr:hypothetical protein [Kutzneria albida]AHI00264.1 hypothetical protein KALB_6905 [Kutzneria albida DSM 43870]MBA8925440.1 hypothetical protein [Kutzneria viridogrisea]
MIRTIGRPRTRRGLLTASGYAAGAWAAVYTAANVHWALGGTAVLGDTAHRGLPLFGPAPLAAAMGALGVVLALALVRPWGRGVPRWLLTTLGWIACVGPGAHAINGLGQEMLLDLGLLPAALRTWSTGQTALVEGFFLCGAVLFGVAVGDYLARQPQQN